MKWLITFLLFAVSSAPVLAFEYSGNIAAELQVFPQPALFEDQLDDSLSLSFKPKFSQVWNKGNDELSIELFFRADDKDDERQHADIREFKWLRVAGSQEWRIGIDTVFWGVTESQHLVDVINQIDSVEGVDGEDKLGQPMIHFTTIQDWGVFHAFVLTGFREETFHAKEGRLRFPLVVDNDQATYESSDEDSHIDYAIRYEHFLGDTEFGLSWFNGTNRDAGLSRGQNGSGQPVLIPYYSQMTQFGLDMQSIIGDWIWKLEWITRDSNEDTFNAVTAGFEYTFYGIMNSAIDLGTLLEYSWEDRDENVGVFDNDLFAGFRFAFNDVQSTEILAGFIVDTDQQSKSMRVEASRRLGDSWKLTGELQVFSAVAENDPLKAFEKDDYLLLELARYF